MKLEDQFAQALNRAIEMARKHNYTPTYFMQMLGKYGAVETAKRLLANTEPQIGLFELWRLGILSESLEAVICDHPEFHGLFSETEIAEARRRLNELGYFKK